MTLEEALSVANYEYIMYRGSSLDGASLAKLRGAFLVLKAHHEARIAFEEQQVREGRVVEMPSPVVIELPKGCEDEE